MATFSMQGWIVVQRRRDGSFDPVKGISMKDNHDLSVWWSKEMAETEGMDRITKEDRQYFMVAPVLVQGLEPGSVK